jgi:hypothetical protein
MAPPPNNGQAMVPVEHLQPVARPDQLSQATAVEQSRAVAEVLAAVEVAQRMPRNIEFAKAEMRRACDEYALASRAFYRYPRGGKTVTGASVHLAREAARCWGNIDYGIAELARRADHSEMKAWAWDQQTNARPSTTFIVPHQRDADGKRVPLETDRDVYENNANQGGRRVRQMIFAVLPVWFVQEAEDRCRATIERGDGRPLEERIESAVDRFAELGVSVDRLEAKVGRQRAQWNARDLADLTVVNQSIRRGEVSIDDEFPPQRITVDEVLAAGEGPETPQDPSQQPSAAAAPNPPPTEPDGQDDANGSAATPAASPEDHSPGAEPVAAAPDDLDGGLGAPPEESGATPADPIAIGQLVKAAQAAGRIDGRLSVEKGRTPLLGVAAELLGSTYGAAEDLVRDQQVAEELLAKLTPAAES